MINDRPQQLATVVHDLAHPQVSAAVWTNHIANGGGIFQDHRIHAVAFAKVLQSFLGNVGPVRLRPALLFPFISQYFGKYRGGPAIFFLIRQHAALRDRPETVKIHAWLQQILWIQCEQRIFRGVIANP